MSFRVKLRLKRLKLPLAEIMEAARKMPKPAPVLPDWPKGNECVPAASCKVCGISFTDPMGRPVAMGYVCSNGQCPSRIWAGPAFPPLDHQRYGHGSTSSGISPNTYLWNGAAA